MTDFSECCEAGIPGMIYDAGPRTVPQAIAKGAERLAYGVIKSRARLRSTQRIG